MRFFFVNGGRTRVFLRFFSTVLVVIAVLGVVLFWKGRDSFPLIRKKMPFKIAIVDGTRIQKESKTFLTIVELEKRLLDEANADLSEKYKKLHALFKDSKNPNHSAQERQNYKKQFNSEFAILEPQIQKKKEEKKRQIAVITARINEEVTAVTHALAKKYKLDLILNTHVFDKITVFYASPTIDLTNEAIQALDKKMPELVAWLAKQ